MTFKSCAPFTNCIVQINNTQTDNAKVLGIVMPMYNLIEYSVSYAKTSGGVWQHHKNDLNDSIRDSESFKLKARITAEMHLINCVVTYSTSSWVFKITDTKPYVPVITLSTHDKITTTIEIRIQTNNQLE